MKLQLCAFGLLLGGCAATPLHSGAERILVTHQAAPPGCRYMGTVIGEQGGSLVGNYTSNATLAEGAMNDMKNKAQSMGANYVVLEDSAHGNTMSGGRYGVSGGQTDVTHTGNAFNCPEAGTAVVVAPAPPAPKAGASHL